MQQNFKHHTAFAPEAALPAATAHRFSFGLPRAYIVRQLRARIAELLYIGADACQAGYLDRHGAFVAMDDDDAFDGPDFVLQLTHDMGSHRAFSHRIDLRVAILMGSYKVQVHGRCVDIAVLPSLDTVQLDMAAQWLIRNIDRAAHLS